MNRRDALKTLAIAAASGGLISKLGAADAASLDKYGGWTGKKFKATGFFRIEKDDRWWFVTPEGNAFLSFGINHVHLNFWREKHNANAWQNTFGIENIWANEQFFPALRDWVLQACEEYGFNTIGVHNELRVLNNPSPKVPYMQPFRVISIPHWWNEIPDENFVDVFEKHFEVACDKLAKEVVVPVRDDPYLLGYSMNDCPLFTEEDCRERTDVIGGKRRALRSKGWPRRLRNLGADAPGKQAYVRLMKKIYRNSIKDFNTTYGTSFKSFDALASAVDWRPDTELSNANETRDNTEFLLAVVDRYYQCASDAIRRHDPNHLFVGDKLNANTDAVDTVLKVTSKYTDILFYQMYAKYEVQEFGLDRWSKIVDQPIINGDSAFTMVTDTMPHPFGPIASSLEERIEWTDTFFHKAFARPEFIGWHYCGLVDADNNMPKPERKYRQHSGLLDTYGVPYPGLKGSIKGCVDQMYQ
ncbi:MAG: twin-arginine translocation signal domain-containing protein, partial [Verrucomicrobia bacterium]|nr:twin-arginine translocation signal domain-containing protein [Verrucomicrobiota bacterium]